MKSAYSQKYFYAAVNYIEPQYEGKYTIEEIAQGPEVAPNAYSKPNLGIHLYCKREDREAAIREQWETLRKMKADGINMDHWTGGIKVSDEELLQEKPELLKCYEDADLGNSEMILLDEYQDGRVWIFSGDYAVVSQGFYNFYNDYNNSHNANAQ